MHPFDGGCSNFSVCKDYVGHLFKMHFLVPHPWRSSSSTSVVRPRNCSNNPEDSEFPGHSGNRVVTIKLSLWFFYDVHFKFLVSSEKAFFGEDKEYPLRVIFLYIITKLEISHSRWFSFIGHGRNLFFILFATLSHKTLNIYHINFLWSASK